MGWEGFDQVSILHASQRSKRKHPKLFYFIQPTIALLTHFLKTILRSFFLVLFPIPTVSRLFPHHNFRSSVVRDHIYVLERNAFAFVFAVQIFTTAARCRLLDLCSDGPDLLKPAESCSCVISFLVFCYSVFGRVRSSCVCVQISRLNSLFVRCDESSSRSSIAP